MFMYVAGQRCRPEMCLWMNCLQVPREALEIAGTSIKFRASKFGFSICPLFNKGHAELFREFWHDFATNRTYDLLNLCRYPVRPLSLSERRLTSILANLGNPYVLFLAKFMPKKFVDFGMTLLKIRHMEKNRLII